MVFLWCCRLSSSESVFWDEVRPFPSIEMARFLLWCLNAVDFVQIILIWIHLFAWSFPNACPLQFSGLFLDMLCHLVSSFVVIWECFAFGKVNQIILPLCCCSKSGFLRFV